MDKKKRIIDKRVKEKFLVDDLYLNGQAKICGWQATLVYLSICRHASKDQESFPSIKLMQEELGVGRNTIIKGIENLERQNVIHVEKERSKAGKWLNNRYILIDKSEWIKSQVPDKDTAIQVPVGTHPSPRGDKTKSSTGTLRKHIEGNTYKETHIANPSGLQAVIQKFEIINPNYEQLFRNKTQRSALDRLVKKYGEEKVSGMITACAKISGDRYAPTITTPVQLEQKLGDLVNYFKKQKNGTAIYNG